MQQWPHTTLRAAGEAVGLPAGTVGNSEAGHLHIGAGRRIYSDRVKIDRAIADGSFFRNEAFLAAIRTARDRGTALHLMGIVSFFSSHGSINHLFALMDLARREGVGDLFIHAMLGRRGEMPESGAHYVGSIEDESAGDRPGQGRLGHRSVLVDGPGGELGPDREDLPHARLRRGNPLPGPRHPVTVQRISVEKRMRKDVS